MTTSCAKITLQLHCLMIGKDLREKSIDDAPICQIMFSKDTSRWLKKQATDSQKPTCWANALCPSAQVGLREDSVLSKKNVGDGPMFAEEDSMKPCHQ